MKKKILIDTISLSLKVMLLGCVAVGFPISLIMISGCSSSGSHVEDYHVSEIHGNHILFYPDPLPNTDQIMQDLEATPEVLNKVKIGNEYKINLYCKNETCIATKVISEVVQAK